MKPFRITRGGIGCYEPNDRAMTMAIPENGSGHFDEIPVKPPPYEAVTLREPENGVPRFDTLPSEPAPGLLPFFGPQRNPDANPTPYAVTLMDPENGNPRFDEVPILIGGTKPKDDGKAHTMAIPENGTPRFDTIGGVSQGLEGNVGLQRAGGLEGEVSVGRR